MKVFQRCLECCGTGTHQRSHGSIGCYVCDSTGALPGALPSERQQLKDRVWLDVAIKVSGLGTCPRRYVGCVLVDKRGHVLSTGHNGAAAGQPHCIEQRCPGADLPSGTGLDQCEAIHAEANALLQCERVWDIHTVYCTDSPCVGCVKLLLNTSASRICFVREYPAPASRSLWLRSRPDREWIQTGDDLR